MPCLSHVDPQRNSHRDGEAWSLRTGMAILANARYTGRQVWNRQGRDHDAHHLSARGVLAASNQSHAPTWAGSPCGRPRPGSAQRLLDGSGTDPSTAATLNIGADRKNVMAAARHISLPKSNAEDNHTS